MVVTMASTSTGLVRSPMKLFTIVTAVETLRDPIPINSKSCKTAPHLPAWGKVAAELFRAVV